MKNARLTTLWAGLLVLLFSPLFANRADAQDLSGIPGAFVDVGFGARPVALGSAYVGLADDVHSVVWNPAGLATLSNYQIAFSYIDQLGLVDYQHAAASAPFGFGALGLAVIANGDDAMRELSVHAAYARSISDFHVGLALKYRNASFGNNTMSEDDFVVFEPDEIADGLASQVSGSASGFGLDLGVLYQPTPKVSFGLMLRDLVAPVSWDSQTGTADRPARGSYNESIPFEAALGTVYRVSPNFMVTADYNPALSDEVSNKVRVGLETKLLNVLSLRGGMQQFVNDLRDEKYALGFGLDVPVMGSAHVMASYTYLFESLDNSQHISFAVSF